MDYLMIIFGIIAFGVIIFYAIRENKQEEANSNKTGSILHFKEGLKIFRFEDYRGVSIIYISRHKDQTQDPADNYYQYQFFWKGELQYDESNDLEELRSVAVDKIDDLIDNG